MSPLPKKDSTLMLVTRWLCWHRSSTLPASGCMQFAGYPDLMQRFVIFESFVSTHPLFGHLDTPALVTHF
jgi:hypothetical protein